MKTKLIVLLLLFITNIVAFSQNKKTAIKKNTVKKKTTILENKSSNSENTNVYSTGLWTYSKKLTKSDNSSYSEDEDDCYKQ